MPKIWSYCDAADRGFGLFKRRIFTALREQGWQTRLAEAPLLDPASKSLLREDFFSHPCDWIFLINQPLAHFYDYLEIPPNARPPRQKALVWYLDDPHFFIHHKLEPNEHVLCFDETYLDYVEAFQPASLSFWPLAADISEPGEYRQEYACDVCFVGGLIDQSQRRAQLSEQLQDYVDRLVEEKLKTPYKSYQELALEFPIEPGKTIQLNPQVNHYLYWEANNRYRMRTLEALTGYDLRIYGNQDWETVAADSPLLNHFHGPADPVTELPHIFVSASININLHSIQCRGSLNQRDFNAPIAGGFLLADWVPASAKYFLPGQEAVYWNGIDDLRHKIDYFIEHPSERSRIVEQGRKRVSRDHTYTARVQDLHRLIKTL